MAYSFRPYRLDQQLLLPTDMRAWLPEGHLALFLADVVGQLDLSPIMKRYPGGRGPRGYHPRLLLTVLVYGYSVGVFSSRKLAARCETDVAFRVLSGGECPDFRTLADFRKRHLAAMEHLFLEVLRLCREAGLLAVGHLSLDGSKYQANASKHKAMSYGRIQDTEARLAAEIKALLERAARQDQAEDDEHGPACRGDDLPEELRRRTSRLEQIQAAKARLQERARQRATERAEAKGAGAQEVAEARAAAVPRPNEQSNFTDPESRILQTKTGWVQGYNAQVVVEAQSGVIVADEVTGQSADSPRLPPLLDQVETNLTGDPLGVASRPPNAPPPASAPTRATVVRPTWPSWRAVASMPMWPLVASGTTAAGSVHRGGRAPRYAPPCGRSSAPRRAVWYTRAARASPNRCTE